MLAADRQFGLELAKAFAHGFVDERVLLIQLRTEASQMVLCLARLRLVRRFGRRTGNDLFPRTGRSLSRLPGVSCRSR